MHSETRRLIVAETPEIIDIHYQQVIRSELHVTDVAMTTDRLNLNIPQLPSVLMISASHYRMYMHTKAVC